MDNRPITFSLIKPNLPDVLNEIAERLIADDWCRVSTDDGTRKYYIVGDADYRAHLCGEDDFSSEAVPKPTDPGPLSEWVARSQLAHRPSKVLARARQRLQAAGVPAASIDGFLAGDAESLLKNWRYRDDQELERLLRALGHFGEAVRLERAKMQPSELDHDEKEEVEIRRQKMCLAELAKKYAKIVDRWEQLEPQTYVDRQLEEASRAFLYGFYRATIVLSASAIETHLKRLLPDAPDDTGPFELFNMATAKGRMQPELAKFIKDLFRKGGLFWYRNRVVHDNAEPSSDKAKEILGVARKAVAELIDAYGSA